MSLRSDRRTFGIALGGITLAALVIRVVFVVVVDPKVPRLSDASAYHLLANQLADGHGFVRPFDLRLLGLKHPTAEYPPLFPAVLAAASTVGAKSVEAQRIFCAFLGAGTVASGRRARPTRQRRRHGPRRRRASRPCIRCSSRVTRR